jgi:hypothetical protein
MAPSASRENVSGNCTKTSIMISVIDLRILFITLILTNFLVLYFIKTPLKFVYVPSFILTINLIVFIVYFSFIFPTQKQKIDEKLILLNENIEQTSDINNQISWQSVRTDKAKLYSFNRASWELPGQQILIMFVLQIIGWFKTDRKKLYGRTAIVFGILTLAYLFIELLIGIVPTTGFVG